MRGPAVETSAISALALLLTLVIAWPVLQAPADRLFGKDLVGRHHDPFTVMQRLAAPTADRLHLQPVTDAPGVLLARALGPVAGYNALVLLTFPLSAAAAYALARHLALSHAASVVAALAFAFSPFHLAQGAYHPHIAQTQWLPLYLLALWRCLDGASLAAVTLLVLATIAVTLSNLYGGLIAAVVTPAAMAGYWRFRSRHAPGSARSVAIAASTLLVVGVVAVTCAWYLGNLAVTQPAALAAPADDLARFSASWRSYLLPPVAHPLLGDAAGRLWQAAGVREGLLEQQLALGWGFLALGLVAVHAWWVGRPAHPALTAVPILLIVAGAAWASSLPPETSIGPIPLYGTSALLHPVLPMFRAYARFGLVVQLMVVLLAGIGASCVWNGPIRGARGVGALLLTLGVLEYVVYPPTLWRHVLPTAAHRWVMAQRTPMHVLDCTVRSSENASITWLTGGRVAMRDAAFPDCAQPGIAASLHASSFSHLLVRRDGPAGQWFAARDRPNGLRLVKQFADAEILAVADRLPPVQTLAVTAFHAREHNQEWAWRWAMPNARWAIANPTGQTVVVMLDLEMIAFAKARPLQIRLDGVVVQALTIEARRRVVPLGPFVLTPGPHELAFDPLDPPTVADQVLGNRDRRPLSFAVGHSQWTSASSRR